MGDFLLTGTAQFDLFAGVTQSLAGRAARIELLPLTFSEMASGEVRPASLDTLLSYGGYLIGIITGKEWQSQCQILGGIAVADTQWPSCL